MTDVEHLHNEAKIMPLKDHCEMLSKQFLLSTQKPNHPNRTQLDGPPPDRQMKKTLVSKFGAEISSISTPDIDDSTYKKQLKKIHTNSVSSTLKQMKNKILKTRPPEINDSEKTLPRSTRTTLAQLRSGYSKYLNSYNSRIDPNIEDKCPQCQASHTTEHLFKCPRNPTRLTVRDLWTKPVETARFLNLAHNDNDSG